MPKNLHELPDVNRTKEVFKKILDKNFENYVMEELLAKGPAAAKGGPKVIKGFIEIDGKLIDGIIERKGIIPPNRLRELVRKTAPLAYFPNAKESETLFRVLNIFSNPFVGRVGLSSINTYAAYHHLGLAGKSFLGKNYVDCSYHATFCLFNAYRGIHQLISWNQDLEPSEILFETASVAFSSNLLKIKNLFIKTPTLKNAAEKASLFLLFTLSKFDEPENSVSEKSEETTDNSSTFVDVTYEEALEDLLEAVMVDFD